MSDEEDLPSWYDGCIASGRAAVASLQARPLPPLLFHYTPASGLLGMLNSHSIFATDSRYLNDSQELAYGREVAKRVLLRHFESSVALEIVNLVRDGFSSVEMFVASFSEEPDVLSQWRAYAADGLGYSLGLQTAEALSIESKSIHFLPVIYDEQEQDALVESILAPVLSGLDATDPDELKPLNVAFSEAIQGILPVLKNPGFKEEREWRAVVPVSFWEGVAPTGFRPSRFGITPHVELSPLSGKLPLGAVYMGPKIDRTLGRNALFELLRSKGYQPRSVIIEKNDVAVAASRTSYR